MIVVTILIWLFSIIFLLLAIVIFSPFKISLKIHHEQSRNDFLLVVSYIHPFLIRANINIVDASVNLLILNFIKKTISLKREEVEEEKVEIEEIKPVEVTPEEAGTETKAEEIPAEEKVPVEEVVLTTSEEEKRKSFWDRLKQLGEFKQKITQSRPYAFLKDKKFRNKILRWLKRIAKAFFRVIKIPCMHLYVKYSIDDPASLGKITGYIMGIQNAINFNQSKHQLIFEPDFTNGHLRIRTNLQIETSAAQLVFPFVVLVFSFPYATTLLLWLRIRKQRKSAQKTYSSSPQ